MPRFKKGTWVNFITWSGRGEPGHKEVTSETIKNFMTYFEQWQQNPNVFSKTETEETQFLNLILLTMMELKKIDENKIDDLIKEFKDVLKYNFFSAFWEKKENLKLISKLEKFLIEIDNRIMEQKQEVSNLEKNKLLIEQNTIIEINKDTKVFNDVKDYFSFLSNNVKNEISYLKKANFIIIKNKNIFLEECRKFNKNKIIKEIQELHQKNAELKEKNEKIFEKTLLKEDIMTQLILVFWAYRMKNENKKYELNLENAELENKPNEDFSFFFKLIDTIFNRYIEKIIENEEEIFDDIFKKYYDQKSNLEKKSQEYIQKQTQLEETLKEINQKIKEQLDEITTIKTWKSKKKMHIQILENRKKNIELNRITYLQDWLQDWQKSNLPLNIKNIEKINKEIYLQEIDNVIKKIQEDINNKITEIKQLEDDTIRYIANQKIKEQLDKIKTWKKILQEKQKHIQNLKERKENIELNKTTYLQDWKESNLPENKFSLPLNIEKNIKEINKKKYLQEIDNAVKEIQKDIKNNEVQKLKDDIIRNEAELKINTKKLKKIKGKIARNQRFFSEQNNKMMKELKKIKDKWIEEIRKNQEIFSNFFKKINELKDTEFIEFIENYLTEENWVFLLTLNKEFKIEKNMQKIKELNMQKEEELKSTFANWETDLKNKEREVLENLIKKLQENVIVFAREAVEELKNKATQTEVKRIDIETQTVKTEGDNSQNDLGLQVETLQNKIIEIKKEYEKENEHLSREIEKFKQYIHLEKGLYEKEWEKLKSRVSDKKWGMENRRLMELDSNLEILGKLEKYFGNEIQQTSISLSQIQVQVEINTQNQSSLEESQLQPGPSRPDTSIPLPQESALFS